MYYNYDWDKYVEVDTKSTGRTYKIPNIGKYPSITTILGKTANQMWLQIWRENVGDEEADRISKEATDRGSLVHDYLERFWNEEDITTNLSKEKPDVRLMTNNLIKATKKGKMKVYGQERVVYSKELKYAGRVDVIGEWEGQPAIIDYKTARKTKYAKYIKDYYIQCAAYAQAHNEIYGSNISKLVILITVEDKDVQVFKANLIHHLPDLKYRLKSYYKKVEQENG